MRDVIGMYARAWKAAKVFPSAAKASEDVQPPLLFHGVSGEKAACWLKFSRAWRLT